MRLFLTKLWKEHRSEIGMISGVILLYLTFFAFGITCPIKFITGVSCPGCGMSRACLHAAKLDIESAFGYHPMWITVPFFAFFLIFFKWKKKDLAFNITVGIFAAAMIGVYIWRMLFLPQSIVVFEPENGVFPKLFRLIKNLFS